MISDLGISNIILHCLIVMYLITVWRHFQDNIFFNSHANDLQRICVNVYNYKITCI